MANADDNGLFDARRKQKVNAKVPARDLLPDWLQEQIPEGIADKDVMLAVAMLLRGMDVPTIRDLATAQTAIWQRLNEIDEHLTQTALVVGPGATSATHAEVVDPLADMFESSVVPATRPMKSERDVRLARQEGAPGFDSTGPGGLTTADIDRAKEVALDGITNDDEAELALSIAERYVQDCGGQFGSSFPADLRSMVGQALHPDDDGG